MGDLKQGQASGVGITISLASKADGTSRESTAIDNSTNKYFDAQVQLAIKLQAGSPTGEKAIYVYAWGTNEASAYPDNATGSDADITLRTPHSFKHIGTITAPDSGGLTWVSEPFGVAQAFGGQLPKKWGIVVLNKTGVAFSATEGDHTKTYTGFYGTY